MYAMIDENCYYTVNCCYSGDMFDMPGFTKIECNFVPIDLDRLKMLSYRWNSSNSEWIYDENKYASLLEEQKRAEEETTKIPTVESLQGQLIYLSMMTGVDIDV